MIKVYALSFLMWGLFFNGGVFAQEQVLGKKIEKLIQESGLKTKSLGVWIALDKGPSSQKVYSLNAHKQFIPASLTKIIPAYAALSLFPKGFQFKTQILALPGDISNQGGRKWISGPIYLKGGGDPYFVSESMWKLVNHFVRTEVYKIEKGVVVDDSLFDALRYDPSRESKRIDRAYDSPIGAMSFNWNSVNLYIRPSQKVGQRALVFADPKSEYIVLENLVKTVSSHKKTKIKIQKWPLKSQKRDKFIVSGQISLFQKEITQYRGISYPDFWSAYQLKSFLSQRGILLKGPLKKGVVPKKALVLAEVKSESMEKIVTAMMKFSNNYVAEMLTKNLALLKGHTVGTMEQGINVLKTFLKSHHVLKKEYTLVNPSGLTRKNRFSPRVLAQILNLIRNDFRVFPEYMSALPISGIDGSLKKRMKNSRTQGWVRAKTGSLSGVTALAGFAGSSQKDKSEFQFVFMFNGKEKNRSKAMLLFDQLAETLVMGY